MKILCQGLGGSHSYGLNTPESDIDERGVFINTDIRQIFNITQHEHEVSINDEEDKLYYELRKFVNLLRKGNTGALEILFGNNHTIDPSFKKYFIDERKRFLDSERLYKCLRGYAQGEYRLAIGERTGVIGHKRHEQLKKYGFSPKNFTQLFRLLHVGAVFFDTGEFVVNCKEGFIPEVYDHLMSVKSEPWKYTKNGLTDIYRAYELQLDLAYGRRSKVFSFDETYAMDAQVTMYMEMIDELRKDPSKEKVKFVLPEGQILKTHSLV